MEQNKPNFIPPTSRMTNYVVLRFGNVKPEPNVGLCAFFEFSLLKVSVIFTLN